LVQRVTPSPLMPWPRNSDCRPISFSTPIHPTPPSGTCNTSVRSAGSNRAGDPN
jgi:hypothetical protein